MAPNPRRVDAKLAELYERIPAMKNCQGKCSDSCGPIECSVRERDKVQRESGRRLEAPCGECSMLTSMGRCSVYGSRPLICRLFGTTRGLACCHGCEPERWLSDEEGFALLRDSLLIGGPPAGWRGADLLSLEGSVLSEVAVLQRALRVAATLGKPLGDALASIEGRTAEATPQAASDDRRGRSPRT